MKKFEKKYKELFNNLSIDNDRKDEIYTNIINQKKVHFKLAYIIPVLALFLFTGIVFADNIKSTFNTLMVKYVTKENKNSIIYKSYSSAKINYDADLPEVDNSNVYNYYDISDVEEKLGIKFLKSEKIKNKKIAQLSTIKNNGKIAFAAFKISNAYDEKPIYDNENETQYDKSSVLCDIVISLKTKYSSDKKLEEWSSASNQVSLSEYYIRSIDTTALVRKYEGLRSLREVMVDYNDIRYSISFVVPYDLDPDTEAQVFLDSLFN